MTHRMIAAVLALVGLFLSLYLWLWKIGVLGVLACGDGACETVQLSEYGELFGVPVAFYGVVGYGAMLAVSLVGLHGAAARQRWPTVGLAALAGVGVAFSGYLTYLEAAVIHAWCRWCIVSAIVVVAILATALAGWRRRAWERAVG
ncbi:MAG: vitamin K epoxide reductase family protein [Gemmatimonadota bacterium]|nr:vitamin K epoxide reductase family protein [Gemmatimonadota bacterium]